MGSHEKPFESIDQFLSIKYLNELIEQLSHLLKLSIHPFIQSKYYET